MASNSNIMCTNRQGRTFILSLFLMVIVLTVRITNTNGFSVGRNVNRLSLLSPSSLKRLSPSTVLYVSTDPSTASVAGASNSSEKEDDIPIDYETPEDAIINIKPRAMMRLRELREKEQKGKEEEVKLVLRMGVRNGGCSGLSYVMDFSSEDSITDDDQVDEYPAERLKCVVDAKSMLYLYGLEVSEKNLVFFCGFEASFLMRYSFFLVRREKKRHNRALTNVPCIRLFFF